MKKKYFAAGKLVLSRDTVKKLENARLHEVVGGISLPNACPIQTAKVDCG
jgi:hypothetical protein